MFSQRAIFIDAGFLHAAGGMHVAGTSYRKATRVNHERLINGILKCTEEHSGLDLVGIAETAPRPWAIYSRATTTSPKRSRQLRTSACEVLEKPGTAYPLQPVASPAAPAEVPPNEAEAGTEAASSSSQEIDQPLRQTARVTVKPAPPRKPLEYTPPNFSSHDSHLVYSSGPHGSGSAIPGEEDAPLLEAAEVGVHVATHWYGTVTQQELSDLLADRPVLPADVDRVLLKDCAQRIGELKTDYKSIRQELRRSFWDEIDELVAGKRS